MKKIIAPIAVAILLPFLGAAKPETNTNINTNTNNALKGATVHGQLKAKLHFQKSEVEAAKNWRAQSQKLALDNLDNSINVATDATQKSMLQNTKDMLQNNNTDQQFTMNSDGSADLNGYLPNIQVTVDDQTVTTDSKGNYKIKGIGKGKKNIQISYQNQVIANKSTDISSDTTFNLDSTVTTTDVTNAFTSMGDMSGTGQGVRKYPAGVATGDSSHLGRMSLANGSPVVWKNGQPTHVYVKCNEASTDSDGTGGWYYDDWRTDARNFPNNFSDCSRNISFGFDYSMDQSRYSWYWASYVCWLEAIQRGLREMGYSSQNIYCNGGWYNGHVNCSWFNGVQEPEELHTGW